MGSSKARGGAASCLDAHRGGPPVLARGHVPLPVPLRHVGPSTRRRLSAGPSDFLRWAKKQANIPRSAVPPQLGRKPTKSARRLGGPMKQVSPFLHWLHQPQCLRKAKALAMYQNRKLINLFLFLTKRLMNNNPFTLLSPRSQRRFRPAPDGRWRVL